MEAFGFVCTVDWALVAVVKGLELTVKGTSVFIKNAKKVFVYDSNTLIAYKGGLRTQSNLRKYLDKLSSLGNTITHDAIVEDLKTVFGFNGNIDIQRFKDMTLTLEKIKNKLSQAANPDGTIDMQEVGNIISSTCANDEELSVIVNGFNSVGGIQDLYSNLLILSSDNQKVEADKIFLGGFSIDSRALPIIPGQIWSEVISDGDTPLFTKELSSSISTIQYPNGEYDEAFLIRECKQKLNEVMLKASPTGNRSEIIFYEISKDTEFLVSEPNEHLAPINITD